MKYYTDKLIINSLGHIGLATCWSLKDKYLDVSPNIKVIGNLYTETGIMWLMINTLLDPDITHITILGRDLNHVKDKWKLLSVNPENELQKYFFEHITWNIDSIIEVERTHKEVIEFQVPELKAASKFPSVDKVGIRFASEGSCFMVEGEFETCWKRILKRIHLFGTPKSGYEELSVVVAKVDSIPQYIPEWEEYSKSITSRVKPDDSPSAYGERIGDSFDSIMNLSERRRYIPLHKGVNEDPINPPCLCSLQILNDTLICYFRSHDIYNAWRMNVYALNKLYQKFSNVQPNKLIVISISAHVYENDLPKIISDVLECKVDPRGYFIIKRGEVVLCNYDHSNIKTFTGSTPQKLFEAINIHISDIQHALYLGKEIYRSFIEGDSYIQD